MVECAALPSNFKLQLPRSDANGSLFKSQKSFAQKFPRSHRLSSLSLWRASKHNAISVCKVRSSVSHGSPSRCSCLGTMIDIESAAASEWVPVIDQVLLTASVLLAYMAGAVPSGRSYINSQKNDLNDMLLPESPIFFGSTREKEDQDSCLCTWNLVKGKITESLLAIENGAGFNENSVEFESDHAKRPLSLYAVANGPRFRLLLSSVEQLEKEVNGIPEMPMAIKREEWLGLFSSAIKKACQSALYSWMEKEFCTKNRKLDKELLFSMSEKLRGDDIILGNIRKSGKMELFADLIGFLRYGDLGKVATMIIMFIPLHAVAILEDLIISLADAVSSVYLEVISVDSDASEKISNFGLSLCTLSTRALQKLRNEVAMREWIYQNFGQIVLMYEIDLIFVY
ncbi:Cell division protein ZapD [Bienertia sinuspersici]